MVLRVSHSLSWSNWLDPWELIAAVSTETISKQWGNIHSKNNSSGGGETAAVRQRRQDDGGMTTVARQQRRWRRKKTVADSVISILFIYICVRFLVIFVVLSSYLFPAVLFHLFYCFAQIFLFLTRTRARQFWRSFASMAENWSENSKISFFIICEV